MSVMSKKVGKQVASITNSLLVWQGIVRTSDTYDRKVFAMKTFNEYADELNALTGAELNKYEII